MSRSGSNRLTEHQNIFATIETLRRERFAGFVSVRGLRSSELDEVPAEAGVYMALWQSRKPRFREQGPIAVYKNRCGFYAVDKLNRKWVKGALVQYIGKTEAISGLNGRIKAFLDWGKGKTGHAGGRAVWQMVGSERMLICWKPVANMGKRKTPLAVEIGLISQFERIYGRLPFANWKRR